MTLRPALLMMSREAMIYFVSIPALLGRFVCLRLLLRYLRLSNGTGKRYSSRGIRSCILTCHHYNKHLYRTCSRSLTQR
ncbi:hypothetical protein DEU56DRAFT_771527 [Suillus clintonianus]|uniref:uncharacterized protein n=1 Tax=Suillus clintonianus TaxID=1904413 RepID=UPI001B8613E5|nr:uncharacterized protein DEU56DRAFT_771527 [Suillus clintonianus]KAG2153873.1 hypothetical protein DEU56DRAFT_771527 [Suillus clintonianus]